MEFISLDIETTGLDVKNDQILEFGAIIEDTNNLLNFDEIPKFHAIINHHRYMGTAYAIAMNARIFEILQKRVTISDEDEKVAFDTKFNIVNADDFAHDFYYWCMLHLKNKPATTGSPIHLLVAGKNVSSFDIPFLENHIGWRKFFKFHHRSLDPGTLYTDFKTDNLPPSLYECLNRAGINQVVTHEAIQDAWQVIEVLRKKY